MNLLSLADQMKTRLTLFTILFVISLISVPTSGNKIFAATDTFSADGQIGSLVLGMPPSTNTVNMSSVDKFVLSGYWKLVTENGKIADFTSEFYTGHVNGANNHTHQLTNLRVQDDKPLQLSADGSTQISGLTDVKTNGKKAWNDVPTTISISKGRTISIDIADNGTQRHFMDQPIYGIVKDLTIMSIPSNDTMLDSNLTSKSSTLNSTIPEQLPPQSINGSNLPKI
jgi:hypothetical protein